MGNGRPGKLLKNLGWIIRCRSENPRVGSSILPPATNNFSSLYLFISGASLVSHLMVTIKTRFGATSMRSQSQILRLKIS
jgi:hypothetical protein